MFLVKNKPGMERSCHFKSKRPVKVVLLLCNLYKIDSSVSIDIGMLCPIDRYCHGIEVIFVHKSLHMHFSEERARKYFTIACGQEWTGGDVFDDYC